MRTTLICAALLASTSLARAATSPHVAVVKCEETYAEDWYGTDSTAQSLVGLAGLLGVRYDTITLAELLVEPVGAHTSLWFAACMWVDDDHYTTLVDHLSDHLDAGGSVFLDGPLGVLYVDEFGDEQYRSMAPLAPILGVNNGGSYPFQGYTVQTTSSSHDVAARAGFGVGENLSRLVQAGMEMLELDDAGDPASSELLALVSTGGESYPYLLVTEPVPGARVVAVASYGDSLKAAVPFTNSPAPEFFDSRVAPYLLEALTWAVAPDDQPFAGLALSHAPMTMIGRLDADYSDDGPATTATFAYLVALAEQTGVATVYGIVSQDAEVGGVWPAFRDGGELLQALGGSIGTHSRTHPDNMSDTLADPEWDDEVAGALQDIRDALTDPDFAPDAYAFINPGNTIRSEDYWRFFDAIDLYMSHGFELRTPYGSGVQTFAGVDPTAVVNNVLVPDYQWLYSSSWTTTVAEAAAYQALILDFYQHTIGRGALYNQMWHDYAISNADPPPHDPGAPSTLPLFDTAARHFEQNWVYAPTIAELVGKMFIAQSADVTSTVTRDLLEVAIDYSSVPVEHRGHVAGMGLWIHLPAGPIQRVTVDGAEHYAFTEEVVMMPPAAGTIQVVQVFTGAAAMPPVRLVFASKAISSTVATATGLIATVERPGSPTKFCFAGPRQVVILRVDSFAQVVDGEICGRLLVGNPQATIELQGLDTGFIDAFVRSADRGIASADAAGDTISLHVMAGPAGEIVFEALNAPELVLVDGVPIAVDYDAGRFAIPIPASLADVSVEIVFTVCFDGTGFCKVPDAGVPDASAPDATPIPDASPPDATPVPDAMVPVPDAMVPVPDATVPVPDATVPVPDATVPVPDASAADARAPDASGPDAMAPPRNDSGGCSCRTGDGAPPWAAAGIALALLWCRRRRYFSRR